MQPTSDWFLPLFLFLCLFLFWSPSCFGYYLCLLHRRWKLQWRMLNGFCFSFSFEGRSFSERVPFFCFPFVSVSGHRIVRCEQAGGWLIPVSLPFYVSVSLPFFWKERCGQTKGCLCCPFLFLKWEMRTGGRTVVNWLLFWSDAASPLLEWKQ